MYFIPVLLFRSPGIQFFFFFFSVINSSALNTNVHVGIEMSKSYTIVEEDLPLYGVAQGKL